MKKKKIYIAGGITNVPNYKERFEKVALHYRSKGYVVLNPSELPAGMSPGDYMRICLPMVDSSDEVCFLPEYQESKGAMIEHAYADYIGTEISYWDGEL